MALLTVTTVSRSGVQLDSTLTAATATTGDTFVNTGLEYLAVVNGSGSPINVTIPLPPTPDGLAVTSRVVAVAAGKTELIGPFPTGQYNDSTGVVKATCSSVTSVTLGAFKFPAA
jgi:hypothetical protein